MLHVNPDNFPLTDALEKVLSRLKRKRASAAMSAFEVAGVDPLSEKFVVVIGAMVDAVTCSDPKTLEKYRLAGEARIMAFLPDATFTAQPALNAQVPIAPGSSVPEPKEIKDAIVVPAPKMAEKIEASPMLEDDDRIVKLLASVPQRLAPDDEAPLKALRLFCNANTKMKNPGDFIWQGHANVKRVEAIVSKFGGSVVEVPKSKAFQDQLPAEKADLFDEQQGVSSELDNAATSTDVESTESAASCDAVSAENAEPVIAYANINPSDPAAQLASTDDGKDVDAIIQAHGHGAPTDRTGQMAI
ncbi:hypothetical protein GGD83_003471 [Rhodoblastus sphagnicola]|nr:hypothetical protein [Rhodoblastus sphagnicola]MBB4199650.1 hypothetical protein [Rhodoblastus sphagnicola]